MDPYVLCHIFRTTPLPLICPPAGSWFTILPFGHNMQNKSPGILWAALGGLYHLGAACILGIISLFTTASCQQDSLSKQFLTCYFLPAASEPRCKVIPQIQSLWGLPVQPWTLGSTAGGNSPCPVPHNCTMPDTAGGDLSCGQHHAGDCLKTSQQIRSAEN